MINCRVLKLRWMELILALKRKGAILFLKTYADLESLRLIISL
jgi:hypothetical protein